MSILKSFFGSASAFVALTFVGIHTTQAAIVSETFETPALGATVTTGNSIFNGSASGGAFTVQSDTGSGAFTGSQFMRYIDGSGGTPTLRSTFAPVTGVFQLSWDYFEPKAIISGTGTHFRILLSNGDPGTTTNRAVDLLFTAPNDGTAIAGQTTNWNDGLTNLAAYPTDTLAHFDLVGNVGASTSYGGEDLPTQTYDLYYNGNLVGNNLVFRGPNDGGGPLAQITQLGVGYPTGGNSRVQNAFIDNIVLLDQITVPEPSGIVLLVTAFFGAGIARLRYRKN